MSTETKAHIRTITLTGRPPVRINEDEWPIIALAKADSRNNEHEVTLMVRQNGDGRQIIYGVVSNPWANQPNAKAGIYFTGRRFTNPFTFKGMKFVVNTLSERPSATGAPAWDWPGLLQEWVADLPAETL